MGSDSDQMNNEQGSAEQNRSEPAVYIVSGGVGASAVQLVNTVLAQFPNSDVEIHLEGNVRQPEKINAILSRAQAEQALVAHTLVDSDLRRLLTARAREMGVQEIDLMGPILEWISGRVQEKPVEQPGLYRRLNLDYFERVSAIDFTLAHDDGKNIEGWDQAEVILTGVSRVGKTPLSIYLAVLGQKVANLPLVPELPLPEALLDRHRQRIIGLTIHPQQLLVFRRQRQARLGVTGSSDYVNLDAIEKEVRQANRIFQQYGFVVMDMTDKTIELAAEEILRRLAAA